MLSEYGNPLHSSTAGSAVASDSLQQGKEESTALHSKLGFHVLKCQKLFPLLNENGTSVAMRRLLCSSAHNKQQARWQGIFQTLMEAV